MEASERPQEKLERFGAGSLSDRELLAMLLRSGCKGTDVLEVAGNLLRHAGGLNDLLRLEVKEISKTRGIGKVKALQLVAVLEIARRILHRDIGQCPVLDEAQSVYRFMLPHCAGLDVEKFWVLNLNRKNRLLRMTEITSGTANASLVHPREVFREAIRAGASAIICVHNHPSGDPAPSSADIRVTRQLRQSASIVQIDMLDHVIVGETTVDPLHKGYYSFNEHGLM